MSEPEEFLVLKQLTDALDNLKVAYAIGGSIASSVYGKVRFTQDADITASLLADRAERLYALLKDDFYISRDAMYRAISERCSFNVVHLTSAFKIDIFVQKDDDFHEQIFTRRRKLKLDESIDHLFDVVSPEDVILLKLQWYQSADCMSQRQWSDVLGVLAVRAGSLDMEHLRNWSEKLGLAILLEKAVRESEKQGFQYHVPDGD